MQIWREIDLRDFDGEIPAEAGGLRNDKTDIQA